MLKTPKDTRDEMYNDFRKDAGCSGIAAHWANLVFDLGYRKVIFCKDCAHKREIADGSLICVGDGLLVGEYDYCSSGEPEKAGS